MREFTEDDTTIEVLVHIRKHKSDPEPMIDLLVMVDVRGSRERGQAMFDKLTEQYRGKTYREWGSTE